MKDYRLFDVSDFLMDEDFIRWVRFRRAEDNDFWNSWMVQHSDKQMVIAEAKSILESFLGSEKKLPEAEKDLEIQKLLLTIQGPIEETSEAIVRELPNKRRRWYVAAAVAVVVVTSLAYLLFYKESKHSRYDYASVTPSKQLLESVNTSSKPVTLTLPDGSTVRLEPNSRVAYADEFDRAATRDIYLLGEAKFTVVKNPSRPFRVFANEIITKVLGTSFTVRSFQKDSVISVVVNTGKVSVYLQDAAKETEAPDRLDGIIVTPNQELVYQKEKQKFRKALRDNPAIVVPAKADIELVYDEVPLGKVFDQLIKTYGINIVFDNDLLSKCTITADLRNVPFYEKLDLICKAIGAEYEVIDGQVVVQTNGCR